MKRSCSTPRTPPCRPHPRTRGVTLVEALVALLVMTFGMMALVELMSSLRRSAEVARQRTEAMRLAQADLAEVRSFAVLEPVAAAPQLKAYSNIASSVTDEVPVEGSNTSYRVTRTVTPLSFNGTEAGKDIVVNVSWKDRAGALQSVQLASWVSRIDPAFSGALSIDPHADTIRLPGERNAAIPSGAKDLGNGSSGFKPLAGGGSAWIFNNVTGMVSQLCLVDQNILNQALSLGALQSCTDVKAGYMVAGSVSFSYDSNTPNPATPASPPLPLDIAIDITSSGHPENKYDCVNDSTTALRQVNYFCVVYGNSDNPPSWSGRVRVCETDKAEDVADPYHCKTFLPVGSNSKYRVCRYSANYDLVTTTDPKTNKTSFTISNNEHPLNYTKVSASLARQNFLVIKNTGSSNCPTADPVNPANGIFVDYSTREVQPQPDAWPN